MFDDALSNLLEILQADYPVLYRLIGDDYFTVMGCRYFQRHPPEEIEGFRFGDKLTFFLKSEKPYANVPSLAELADFETALRRSLVAQNDNVVTIAHWQSMSKASQDAMTFSLHPSLKIMKLEWNAPQIWESISLGAEVPEPEIKPGYWLVYRKIDGSSGWRSAKPLEVAALESVYHGLTFGELREELCHLVDDVVSVPLITETFVCSWLEQGLLLPLIKETCQ